MTETRGPDAHERARRRRRTILVLVAVTAAAIGAVVASVVVAQAVLGTWQLPLLVAQLAITIPTILLAVHGRARRLRRLHGTVAAAASDDAVVTVLRPDALGSSRWLGPRALLTPFVVLVDDDEGFGLWTVRSREAVELMRRPWSSVREIGRREDGVGVELLPADASDGTLTLVPVGLEGSTAQRMEEPGRIRALVDRLRAQHRIACPPAPGSETPSRGRDVDWLGPPDATRPSR